MTINDTHIRLAHGNGGRLMRDLIEHVISACLADVSMDIENDAATIDIDQSHCDVMISSDGFTVKPLEFPGGNIGSLSVHGTCNDLAVSGATPYFLSLNLIIEEGLEIACLQRLLNSLAQAARDCNVRVTCGDTKVVPRGEGSGVYITTTGLGLRPRSLKLGLSNIKAGDRVLVSGPIGDHGIAVMLAREQFGLRGDLSSDAANILPFTQSATEFRGLRFMRDPTRGGLATVLHELIAATGLGARIMQVQVPVREAVLTVCDMLGYDPYYLACEGRVVAIIDAPQADDLLARWRQLPHGDQAAIIGSFNATDQALILETELGGERVLQELEDEPLPRIC